MKKLISLSILSFLLLTSVQAFALDSESMTQNQPNHIDQLITQEMTHIQKAQEAGFLSAEDASHLTWRVQLVQEKAQWQESRGTLDAWEQSRLERDLHRVSRDVDRFERHNIRQQ